MTETQAATIIRLLEGILRALQQANDQAKPRLSANVPPR